MVHITYPLKEKTIATSYDYTMKFLYLFFRKERGLSNENIESPVHKDGLFHVWLNFAQLFLRRKS